MDSTQAVFGLTPPRAYRGVDARPAEIVGKALPAVIDLSVARFLHLAVNGGEPIAIDCALGIRDPRQSTPAEIVTAINSGYAAAQIPATAKLEANRLILATTTTGAVSQIELLPYTEGDARRILFGEVPEVTTGSDPTPAVITGETDLLTPVNLAGRSLLRLAMDGGRPVDLDIAGATPEATFLDEIIDRINGVFPNLASATEDDRLRLTSPTAGEESCLEVLPLRALELIEYPPQPAQDPLPDQPPRIVRHADRWRAENCGVADADLRIELNAPCGVVEPGFVNFTWGLRIRLMSVLSPGDRAELWREPTGEVRAKIIKPDGTSLDLPSAKIRIEQLDEQKSCEAAGDLQDKAAALVLPQGRSEWAYLDCQGVRFDRDRFDAAYFVGKSCAAQGVFNVSRFPCPLPNTDTTVFASAKAPPDLPLEVRFHWLEHQPSTFTVNLPADLPERFGGRFNQARFAKAGNNPEEFKDVVTEPETDVDFLVTRMQSSTLVTAKPVERVPIGFTAAAIPFRKPCRLSGGSPTAPARLYLAERDVPGFIELSAKEPGTWGNAIAVVVRKSAPARFEVTVSYQAARFENARRVVLGGAELPALAENLLNSSPIGVLQAKAGGVKAQVTRDRA